MKVDILEAIDALWARDFPDVPWTTGAVHVEAPPRHGLLQFLVDGGSGTYRITPEGRDRSSGERADLPASAYRLSLAPEGGGILLRVDPAFAFERVRLAQAGDGARPARVACLWQDAVAGQWEVVHNTLDRERALVRAIEQLMAKRKLPFAEDLLKFLRHLLAGQPNRAMSVLDDSASLKRQVDGLRPLCERFQQQLNAHGMKRTFRFWSTPEKAAYLAGTKALMEALSTLTGEVCLGFGAVLGLVRDQDLIGHDDDLDILVAFDRREVADLGQALARVEDFLVARGYEVKGRFFSHLWVRMADGRQVDVFVGLVEEGGSVSFYPSARHSLRQDDLFPLGAARLCGVELPVPADCEAYLAGTYGAGWRKPDIAFAHPWDRTAYADIAGERAKAPLRTRAELAKRDAALRPARPAR